MAQTNYGYDQTGRLTDMTHFRGQTTFVDYDWSFDAANRITHYVNSIDGTADYSNDPTGQLTAADYDYQSDESYLYDENGNRLLANGSPYIVGANNQLLSDGTYRYLYDAEGNCICRFIDSNQNGQRDQGDSEITEYTWDNRNRLRKVQYRPNYGAAVDWVIRYSYDYQNRLVRKRADMNGDGDYEDKQVFAYDENQIMLDFQRTGSGLVQAGDLQWRYLWGPAVDQILAEEAVDNGADGTVQWTLTDHLNTVRDIAKYDPAMDSTTIVNHLVYDAFGQVTSESNPAVDSRLLFTARPFDSDTQLQNNVNRWYDPAVGRWLSEDPIGFAGADGNLYRYVGNRVLVDVDPDGFAVFDAYLKYRNGGRLPKAWGMDITGSAVLGVGTTGAVQLVFFADTCEFGLFGVVPAAANPDFPQINNSVDIVKQAAKRFFLDLPWGYDISLSANMTVASSDLRGEKRAGARSWEGVFYGASGDVSLGAQIGAGGFVSEDGHWFGGSVGVGISVPGPVFRTNPQYYRLLTSVSLTEWFGEAVGNCLCYSLIVNLP